MKHVTLLGMSIGMVSAHLITRQSPKRDFLISDLTINSSTYNPNTYYNFQAAPSPEDPVFTTCNAIVPPGPNNRTICTDGGPITALTGQGRCADDSWSWSVALAEIPTPTNPPKLAFELGVKHVEAEGTTFTACRLIPVSDFACETGEGGDVLVKYVGGSQFDMQAADHECYQK